MELIIWAGIKTKKRQRLATLPGLRLQPRPLPTDLTFCKTTRSLKSDSLSSFNSFKTIIIIIIIIITITILLEWWSIAMVVETARAAIVLASISLPIRRESLISVARYIMRMMLRFCPFAVRRIFAILAIGRLLLLEWELEVIFFF